MKVYDRENGRNPKIQPARSWWLEAETREDFDRAAARESLRMRGMAERPTPKDAEAQRMPAL